MESPKPIPTELKGAEEGQTPSVLARLERREAIVIGRDVTCDLVIHDNKASRRHCRLTRSADGFVLEDLGSKNGTYVDGRRIGGPVQLKPNQVFKIGTTVFFLA